MNDMSSVIVPKSDQINADDLIGRDMTITIREVQIRGGQEQPVSIMFEGSDKAFRPCKSMSRVLVYCWGPDARQYVGRSLTLYRDPNVKWGGMAVGGIRISHASHIDSTKTMVLAESKASRKPYTVKPLTAAKPAPVENDPADDKNAEDLIGRIEAAAKADKLESFLLRPQVIQWRAFFASDRHDLSVKVESVIAALSPGHNEGPADTDRGEQHSATVQDETTESTILAAIEREKTRDALDSYMERIRGDRASLDEAANERISDAYNAKWGGLPE